jgi:proline iminopeptidase
MTKPKSPATSSISDSDWKYPQKKANKTGHLQVDTDPAHKIYWEEYGNPKGEPVMFLHGGPGGACSPQLSRFFDPERYRIILFDQRGCGKSTPNVAANGPEIALKNNNTDALVEDIVKLRKELGIEGKMHVFGGSWGSTLSLTYAIRHPETVETLILRGIFLGNPEDLAFMYQGNAATYAKAPYKITEPGTYIQYPEAWKKFVEIIPPAERGDMMKAYKKIFDMKPKNDAEKKLQQKAAVAWSVWEGTISHLIPDIAEAESHYGEADFAVCFAQIEAHYFANNLFLPPDYIIKNVPALKNIPTHIVHGHFDLVCPLPQAEDLNDALIKVGNKPVTYVKPTAGHSALEIENCRALAEIMDDLRKMPGFEKKAVPKHKPKGMGR